MTPTNQPHNSNLGANITLLPQHLQYTVNRGYSFHHTAINMKENTCMCITMILKKYIT